MSAKMKIRRASGIVEADAVSPSEKQELNTPAAPGELTDAMIAGIGYMAQDIGEAIELRLKTIFTAAVKAGERRENRAGVEAMTREQVTELMNDAAALVEKALDAHFSGTDPIQDNILGNYSVCL